MVHSGCWRSIDSDGPFSVRIDVDQLLRDREEERLAALKKAEAEKSKASKKRKPDSSDSSSTSPQDLPSLIQRVATIFQPGKMSITLFTSSHDCDGLETSQDDSALLHALQIPGYVRKDRIFYEFVLFVSGV